MGQIWGQFWGQFWPSCPVERNINILIPLVITGLLTTVEIIHSSFLLNFWEKEKKSYIHKLSQKLVHFQKNFHLKLKFPWHYMPLDNLFLHQLKPVLLILDLLLHRYKNDTCPHYGLKLEFEYVSRYSVLKLPSLKLYKKNIIRFWTNYVKMYCFSNLLTQKSLYDSKFC